MLSALVMGLYPAESSGPIHHLPKARLAGVMDGLRERGLLDATGRLTDAGRATKGWIESLTDALAKAPYDGLASYELDQLIALLEPSLNDSAHPKSTMHDERGSYHGRPS